MPTAPFILVFGAILTQMLNLFETATGNPTITLQQHTISINVLLLLKKLKKSSVLTGFLNTIFHLPLRSYLQREIMNTRNQTTNNHYNGQYLADTFSIYTIINKNTANDPNTMKAPIA